MTGTQNKIEMSALALLFPIVGDISGAPFEFMKWNVTKNPNVKSPKDVPLFAPPKPDDVNKTRMTDDSALNLAVVKSMMELDGKNNDECIEIFAKNLKEYYHKYKSVPGDYGGSFRNWAESDATRVERGSFGDGGPMRAPLIGMVYNTLEETLLRAEQSAMPTHSAPEGITGTQAIAAAVYLARAGCSKDDIKTYIETKFDYDLDIPLSNYTKYMKTELIGQSETCSVVVPMALRAFLDSDSYEDCLQKTIFAGGDSDTLAAMTGGIAGAFFGMPKKFETQCLELIDEDTKKMAYDFQNFLKARDTEPNKEELESVMAEARLKKYVLDRYKAGNNTLPKKDPEFVDLLAKKEAARLYYEQMKEARQKKDGSEKALAESKNTLMSKLVEAVKGAQDFKDKCNSYTAWPGKDVTIRDCEAIKGYKRKNAPKNSKLFPLNRKVVDHALIPEKIVSNDVISDVISSVNKQKKEEVTNLFKETVLAEIKKELNVDDEQLQKAQNTTQEELDKLKKPRRGFWGTARDIIFGKNNAGRREYDKKVSEYNDKVSELKKEIDNSKELIADAKKQINDRFNIFKSGEVKDEAVKLKNEEYAAKAVAAVKEKFGITTERLKFFLDEDIAKNCIKDDVIKKETEVKESVKAEPEKVQSEPKIEIPKTEHRPAGEFHKAERNPRANSEGVSTSTQEESKLSAAEMTKIAANGTLNYFRSSDDENVKAGAEAISDYIRTNNDKISEALIKYLANGDFIRKGETDTPEAEKYIDNFNNICSNVASTTGSLGSAFALKDSIKNNVKSYIQPESEKAADQTQQSVGMG